MYPYISPAEFSIYWTGLGILGIGFVIVFVYALIRRK